MKLTRNTYIALFLILCGIYYYINNYNFMENFVVEEIKIVEHPYLRTDYNNLEEENESKIHKNLLFNKVDNIKCQHNQPTSRTTGMFTETTI